MTQLTELAARNLGGNDFNFDAQRARPRLKPYSTVTLLARFRG
jgi:hypothetical protein